MKREGCKTFDKFDKTKMVMRQLTFNTKQQKSVQLIVGQIDKYLIK